MTPAVFMDRDNTLIYNDADLGDPDLVELTRGAASAIASLRGLGFKIVVVTNQGGVARGRYTEQDVHAVHQRINDLIRKSSNGASIDAFYYCPFSPNGNLKQYKKDHENRKPNPGMLLQAAEDLKLDLASSWMIGDRLEDVQAGHRAGTRTVLLRADAASLRQLDPAELAGVVSEAPDGDRPVSPDFFASGLIEACRIIAQQRMPDTNEKPKLRAAGRKWDKSKIAELQRPRPMKDDDREPAEKPAAKAGKAFRPWGAPTDSDEGKPIVTKPFRKKLFKEEDEAEAGPTPPKDSAAASGEPAAKEQAPPVKAPTQEHAAEPESEPAASLEPSQAEAESAPQPEIPENIRKAIDAKKARDKVEEDAGVPAPPGPEKTLRLILQEMRMQRNATAEFSYLTVVAIVLQIIAIVCLLGGLWMGGADDGLFLRWFGVALMAQLSVIAMLQLGR